MTIEKTLLRYLAERPEEPLKIFHVLLPHTVFSMVTWCRFLLFLYELEELLQFLKSLLVVFFHLYHVSSFSLQFIFLFECLNIQYHPVLKNLLTRPNISIYVNSKEHRLFMLELHSKHI